jgi:hypothetical protein
MTDNRDLDQTRLDDKFATSQDASTSGGSEDQDDPGDETILIKISDSAVDEDASLAEYVTSGNRLQRFPSLEDAKAELGSHARVGFQAGSANDPDGVDYYCCRMEPSDPPAEERGPPAGGWTIRTRGNAVGAMCEVAFNARSFPKPIQDYAIRTCSCSADQLRGRQRSPSWLYEWNQESHAYELGVDDLENTWIPDAVVVVWDRRRYDRHPQKPEPPMTVEGRQSDAFAERLREWQESVATAHREALLAVYAVEIKHREASFERSQKAALNELHRNDGPVVPLVARMDLTEVPLSYDVRLLTGPFGDTAKRA